MIRPKNHLCIRSILPKQFTMIVKKNLQNSQNNEKSHFNHTLILLLEIILRIMVNFDQQSYFEIRGNDNNNTNKCSICW